MCFRFFLYVCALAIAGCGSDMPATGTLTLAVTDAPIDSAQRVVVFFASVEIKPANGESFVVPVNDQIDLLALAGGGSEIILNNILLDAGHYNWIRLEINAEATMMDSFIELDDGSIHSLRIPSGDQTGLKLIGGFDVPAGGQASFTLDFDLRQSIHSPKGQLPDYIMRPTIRIINNMAPAYSGTLVGIVRPSYVFNELCTTGNAIYVFAGHNSPIDDVDGIAPDPVDSGIVDLVIGLGGFGYRIGNLPVGNYTVAFTCQAGDDDPATDDNILFLGDTHNVTIIAEQTTIQDF